MNLENHPGDDREQQPDPGEARVQELVAKTMERYERLLRHLPKE